MRWQAGAYLLASLGLALAAGALSCQLSQIPWLRCRLTGRLPGVLRGVYVVGFPYFALVLGVVPGSRLGLAGLGHLQAIDSGLPGLPQLGAALSEMVSDWLPDARALAGRAAAPGLLLALAWLGYGLFKRRRADSGAASHPDQTAALPGTRHPPAGGPSLIEAGCQVLHWSFYRAILWLLVDNLYLAAIGGVIVVGLEWALIPGRGTQLRNSSRADGLLPHASLLIANAALFCSVPNLWLLIPVHWLLARLFRRAFRLGTAWHPGWLARF